MEKYEICVIGGGPAGYAAAMRALDLNFKTLLIEKDRIGGAGLYNGALSSKTLWELSKDISHLRERIDKYSTCSTFDLDFSQIKKELDEAVLQRGDMLESHLDALKDEGYNNLFFHKKGSGTLISENKIEITYLDGSKETIFADNIILATGSSPRKLPNIPIDEETIVTSDSIHQWKELPKSLVILGAGVIGCEYATIYSNFGKTKVYLIDKAPRILPFEDEDVANMVEEHFEKNDITIHRSASLLRMEKVDGEVEYEIQNGDGTTETHRVEKALVAVGRVPNTQGLGLEKVGITLNKRGAIENDDTRTSVPNIYAIGDLTADIALVNVGELEGRHAVKRIAKMVHFDLKYDNISYIMFLKPIVAGVGLSEKQCREKGISYQVVTMDYRCIPRAIAMRNPPGFFKIIVTNDQELKVLGMRAVGAQASSAIQAVALLISQGKGIQEIAELIHPHPSLIEGIQECCRMLMGKSIFKPHVFKNGIDYRGYMYEEQPDEAK